MTNIEPLVVNSWVGMRAGCDITYNVHDEETVYITVSGRTAPFEFCFDGDALREFLARGGEALAEMERRG